MKVYRSLKLGFFHKRLTILFGECDSLKEKEEVFNLRFRVYSQKKYINPDNYKNMLEVDEYDEDSSTRYFMVRIIGNGFDKIIGCARLIFSDILPTEKDFSFTTPNDLISIPKNKMFEIGRFIIIPPDRKKSFFLPRGLVRLLLFDSIAQFAIENSYLAGYAFIKKSLDNKLSKTKIPISYIKEYKQTYPRDGVLFNYFNQPDDPVIPVYFFVDKLYSFTHDILNNKFLFKKYDDNTFFFRYNLIVIFLNFFRKI